MSAILTPMSSLRLVMWQPSILNQPLVIIASGPSLTDEQIKLVKEAGPKVLVINDNYLKYPTADFLYACDLKWWDWHAERKELKQFFGQKITQDKAAAEKYNIQYIESHGKMALSTDPKIIHQGMNSGYQAINLAYHMRPTKVILLGYDMQFGPNNESHWFGDHPDKVRSGYGSWMIGYASIAEHAKKLNFEIINCTERTALTCFPKAKLQDVL